MNMNASPYPFAAKVLPVLVLLLLPAFSAGFAAALAEDHTVLYYLIEMQRRVTKRCGGAPMPDAPPLVPSAALRVLAEHSGESGQSPESYAEAHGLAGIPFLALSIPARGPQEAFDRLVEAQCPALMGREYRYIGAARERDQWMLYMAGDQPRAFAPDPGSGGAPLAPESSGAPAMPENPQETFAGAPQDVAASASAIERRGEVAGPPAVSAGNTPIVPAVATRLGNEKNPPAALSVTPVAAFRDAYDPRPAPSVPVAEVPVDGMGRIVGRPAPIAPSSAAANPAYAPAPGAASAYAPETFSATPDAPIYVQPGGAGSVNDPAAPASPVVMRTFEVDATGRILGPVPLSGEDSARPRNGNASPGGIPFSGQAPARLFSGGAGEGENARLLDMVNRNRAFARMCGTVSMPAAPPLRENSLLAAAAQAQADAMAAGGYFSSTSPQGRTLGRRITEAGYAWTVVAENIARSEPPADEALQRWLAEPAQCRNLMGAEYVEAGVGRNAANNLWVFTLAAPAR